MSNIPNQPPPKGRPAPRPTQPPEQKSAVAYPPPRGVPWKCISAMMCKDKSCPGCNFNHPEDYPRLKFLQEVRYPALANHGYLCRKDVTESATIVDQFNSKPPKMTDQYCTKKPVAKRVSDDEASDHVSARWVYFPSIPSPLIDSSMPPYHPGKNLILLPNQSAQIPTSNGYANLYSFDPEGQPVFK